MSNIDTITVADATTEYEVGKKHLLAKIKNDEIQAEKAGDGKSSPWMIDRASLEAYLKSTGKLPEKPPADEPPGQVKLETDTGYEPPNLLTPNPEMEKPTRAENGFQNGDGSRRQKRPTKPRANPSAPNRKPRNQRPRSCSIKVPLRNFKDAMRGLSLGEQVDLRNYLNRRIKMTAGV